VARLTFVNEAARHPRAQPQPKLWSPLGAHLPIPIARRECRRRSMIWT
jgi:hypothetical protein